MKQNRNENCFPYYLPFANSPNSTLNLYSFSPLCLFHFLSCTVSFCFFLLTQSEREERILSVCVCVCVWREERREMRKRRKREKRDKAREGDERKGIKDHSLMYHSALLCKCQPTNQTNTPTQTNTPNPNQHTKPKPTNQTQTNKPNPNQQTKPKQQTKTKQNGAFLFIISFLNHWISVLNPSHTNVKQATSLSTLLSLMSFFCSLLYPIMWAWHLQDFPTCWLAFPLTIHPHSHSRKDTNKRHSQPHTCFLLSLAFHLPAPTDNHPFFSFGIRENFPALVMLRFVFGSMLKHSGGLCNFQISAGWLVYF